MLLLFVDVVRVGCPIIFIPAIWTPQHGDRLVLLRSVEKDPHVFAFALPSQPKPSSVVLTSLVQKERCMQV